MNSLPEAIASLKRTLAWLEEHESGQTGETIDMGVWFSNLAETEMLGFVESPRYADDYLNSSVSEVDPYRIILIPIDRKEFQETYDEAEAEEIRIAEERIKWEERRNAGK